MNARDDLPLNAPVPEPDSTLCFDGGGLVGEQIPRSGRIVTVVDAFLARGPWFTALRDELARLNLGFEGLVRGPLVLPLSPESA